MQVVFCFLFYCLLLKQTQLNSEVELQNVNIQGAIAFPFDGERPWNFETSINNNLSALDYLLASKGSSWMDIIVILDVSIPKRNQRLFIEFDAKDGEVLGHSIYLEKYKSWNGVLITSNHQDFKKIVDKRRKAYAVNACPLYQIFPYSPWGRYEGDDKLLRKNFFKRYGTSKKDFITAEAEGSTFQPARTSKLAKVRSIPCYKLHTILKTLNITEIDVLFLNRNGKELNSLEEIPFQGLNIYIIVVAYQDKITNLNKITKFLSEVGYVFHSIYRIPEPEAAFVDKSVYDKQALQELSERDFFDIILRNTGTGYLTKDYDTLKHLLSIVHD